MAYRIRISELGVQNDDTVFEGQTPADVVTKVVDHLRSRHDIDLPDADEIVGEPGVARWLPPVADAGIPREQGGLVRGVDDTEYDDPAVQTILRRLFEKLKLSADQGYDAGTASEDPGIRPIRS